jgi:glycosyltransferase involved in cell wall biosynthesis
MKKLAQSLGLSDKVIFLHKVPPSRVPFYIGLADVLVSPRLSGTNTPLKIYSWLKSGKPIVATNLWTHTQILSREQAVLVDPDPQSLAGGIEFALKNPEAMTRARAAKEWAEKEFTPAKYLEKMTLILEKSCARCQERG